MDSYSRYIVESNKFTSSRVKPQAFLPSPKNPQLSVFKTNELSNEEIWAIGVEFVANPRRKTLYARADFPESLVDEVGLSLSPDPTPHPLHANLVGWPEEKNEKMAIAKDLANASSLVVRDT